MEAGPSGPAGLVLCPGHQLVKRGAPAVVEAHLLVGRRAGFVRVNRCGRVFRPGAVRLDGDDRRKQKAGRRRCVRERGHGRDSSGLLLFSGGSRHGDEFVVELIEAPVPVIALPVEPAVSTRQRRRHKLIRPDTATFLRGDQAAVLQHTQMLRERRKRHAERLGEFGHRCRAATQTFDHRPPRRIGQTPEDVAEDGL